VKKVSAMIKAEFEYVINHIVFQPYHEPNGSGAEHVLVLVFDPILPPRFRCRFCCRCFWCLVSSFLLLFSTYLP